MDFVRMPHGMAQAKPGNRSNTRAREKRAGATEIAGGQSRVFDRLEGFATGLPRDFKLSTLVIAGESLVSSDHLNGICA